MGAPMDAGSMRVSLAAAPQHRLATPVGAGGGAPPESFKHPVCVS